MLLKSFGYSFQHSPSSNLFFSQPKLTQIKPCKPKKQQFFGAINCTPDVYPGIDEEKFRQDTQDLILQTLTGQAAKKVMYQLEEVDLYVAQWFNHFCADHSPLKGDQFVEELMSQRLAKTSDLFTKKERFISPIDLAHRVLVTRAALADEIAEKLEFTTSFRTVEMERKFLESSFKFEEVGEDVKKLNKIEDESQKVEEETK